MPQARYQLLKVEGHKGVKSYISMVKLMRGISVIQIPPEGDLSSLANK